jgi:hypothetical protein
MGAFALVNGWGSVFYLGLAQAQGPASATMLSIGDGDTIRELQGQQRITVRLACIDAPEMAQVPYGAQSRAYLQTRLRIVGAPVTLLPQTVDRYGRTVAEVIGEINLGLAMVEDGQAYPLRGSAATPTASIWASAIPGSIWMPSSGLPVAAPGCGRCRAASPAPGTFGGFCCADRCPKLHGSAKDRSEPGSSAVAPISRKGLH